LTALERYHWPGNVRQLINALERAKIMADDQLIRRQDLPREVQSRDGKPPPAPEPPLGDDLASIEQGKVVEVLRRMSGNKTRAAKALGIDRRKLYRLVEKYSIQTAEIRGDGEASIG
jgi:transcriptional regulator with PAS, ATPase and Fis domain